MYIDPHAYDDEARAITAALLGDCTAVDDDDLAVHETVSIAAHERGVLGELGRLAGPSLGNPKVVHLQQTFGKGVAEVGVEDTGGDRVDGDAEVCSLA